MIHKFCAEISYPDGRSQSLEAQAQQVCIGLGDDCALQLDHPSVARHHLVLRCTNGQIYVEDLSGGATKVAGEVLEPEVHHAVDEHQLVRVGEVEVTVKLGEVSEESAELHQPTALMWQLQTGLIKAGMKVDEEAVPRRRGSGVVATSHRPGLAGTLVSQPRPVNSKAPARQLDWYQIAQAVGAVVVVMALAAAALMLLI